VEKVEKVDARRDVMSERDLDAEVDRGWFDGSADPNPGGPIGMGWLLRHGGEERSGSRELPAHPANSNNQAEYHAVIDLLEAYVVSGGRGPIIVYGDSQLIIKQLNGEYDVRAPGLVDLHERAHELVAQIPGEVVFSWVPRAQNTVADALASGRTLAEARAAADPARLVYAARAPAPGEVSPLLAAAIARLNRQGSMSFKEGMRLRVGGRDGFSSWSANTLMAGVGDEALAVIAKELEPGAPRLAAYRWTLRGLAAQLACRKGKIDAEVNANAQAAKRSRAPTRHDGVEWREEV
jgi:ribonuclease HI